MARPKRFELLTPRFVVWCSIQLSYGREGGVHSARLGRWQGGDGTLKVAPGFVGPDRGGGMDATGDGSGEAIGGECAKACDGQGAGFWQLAGGGGEREDHVAVERGKHGANGARDAGARHLRDAFRFGRGKRGVGGDAGDGGIGARL